MKLSAESRSKIEAETKLEAEKRYPQLLLRPPVNQLINFIVLTRKPGGEETLELHLNNGGLDLRRGFWLEILPDDGTPGLVAPGVIWRFLHSKLRVKNLAFPPYAISSGYNSNSMKMSLWIVGIPWEQRMEINFQYKLKTTSTPVYLSWIPQKKNLLKNFMALCV